MRYVFAGGCVLDLAVPADTIMVSTLEAVAQPSQVIENFVFPPMLTSFFDTLFSDVVLFVPKSEVLSSASMEASLRSEGSSSAPVSIVGRSFEYWIQPTTSM